MSEEILRALMEMFAMIVKHDGGMLRSEMNYVSDFLSHQLPHKNAEEYFRLFLENAGPLNEPVSVPGKIKPSAKDSVRVFNICKTINRTLTQGQKVVVLIRVFELIDSEKRYSPQRMNIVTTIAEVFRISREESDLIRTFVAGSEPHEFTDPSFLKINSSGRPYRETDGNVFYLFLKVPSVDLYFFRSFGSKNTFINGMQITQGKAYPFAPGSSLTAPPSLPVYYGDVIPHFVSGSGIPRLTFVADHISYRFPDKTPAINDISFPACGGQLIGIMGTSGTGKTTLLNILSGLLKPDTGDIRINSQSVFPPGNTPEGIVGFVPQDDLLIEDLTVFENLYYAASLCYRGKSKSDLTDIVNQMLKTLGLYEKRNLQVGTILNKVISGGQRKRLNIALELIREPSLLFLDEPTSGLSSRDSAIVMDLILELTKKGKLVIAVIHQPSSEIFKVFEKVLILDQEGMMVYYGNPVEAVIYFKTLAAQINNDTGECPTCGTVNPETIFNILEARVVDEFGHYTEKRKVSPEEWAQSFRDLGPAERPEEERSKAHSGLNKPGWLRQLALFMSRDLRSKIANKQYLALILLEGPLLGLILSYVIRYTANPSSDTYIFRENENIPIYIFMSVIVALFLGLTISAEEIFRDRKILKRELFLNLSRSSYLMAKIFVLLIISAFQTFMFLIIANNILEISGLFTSYWLALFATAFCANMIGLNISSAFRSVIAIYIVIPLLMIPMMVLSGAMFPFDKLNREIGSPDKVPFIAEIMPTRWTYEALMIKQFTGNEYDKLVFDLKQQISVADFTTVYRIPEIRKALDESLEQLSSDRENSNENSRLALLRNETERLHASGLVQSFTGLDSLVPTLFTRSIGARLSVWLSNAENEFMKSSNRADEQLDMYINNNKETLYKLYNSAHNDKLEEIMRKYYEKFKIIEYRDRLIQNIDPVYLEPEQSSPLNFRTHFMAPVKWIFGIKTGTFAFNITLVLFSTIVLYLLLYFEVLKKLITFIEEVRLQKN